MIYDVISSLLFLIEKLAFLNKRFYCSFKYDEILAVSWSVPKQPSPSQNFLLVCFLFNVWYLFVQTQLQLLCWWLLSTEIRFIHFNVIEDQLFKPMVITLRKNIALVPWCLKPFLLSVLMHRKGWIYKFYNYLNLFP